MGSYHKRKGVLEDKYGKSITLKPFNDDNVIIDQRAIAAHRQLQDITDEEGLKRAYETNMVYTSIILNSV